MGTAISLELAVRRLGRRWLDEVFAWMRRGRRPVQHVQGRTARSAASTAASCALADASADLRDVLDRVRRPVAGHRRLLRRVRDRPARPVRLRQGLVGAGRVGPAARRRRGRTTASTPAATCGCAAARRPGEPWRVGIRHPWDARATCLVLEPAPTWRSPRPASTSAASTWSTRAAARRPAGCARSPSSAPTWARPTRTRPPRWRWAPAGAGLAGRARRVRVAVVTDDGRKLSSLRPIAGSLDDYHGNSCMVSDGSGGGCRPVVTRWGASRPGGSRTVACRPIVGIDVRRSGGRPRRGPPLPCHLACTPLVAAPQVRPPPASTTGQRTGRAGVARPVDGIMAGLVARDPRFADPVRPVRRGARSTVGGAGVAAGQPGEERVHDHPLHGVRVGQSPGDLLRRHRPAHRALGQPGRRGGAPTSRPVPHHVERGLQLRPQRVARADQEHPPPGGRRRPPARAPAGARGRARRRAAAPRPAPGRPGVRAPPARRRRGRWPAAPRVRAARATRPPPWTDRRWRAAPSPRPRDGSSTSDSPAARTRTGRRPARRRAPRPSRDRRSAWPTGAADDSGEWWSDIPPHGQKLPTSGSGSPSRRSAPYLGSTRGRCV